MGIKLTAPIVTLAVGGIVLYAIGHWQGTIAARDAELDRQTNAALATYKAWHTALASAIVASANYKKEAEEQHQIADAAIRRADSLEAVQTAVIDSMGADTTTVDSLKHCIAGLVTCEKQTDQLRTANTALVKDTVAISLDRDNWMRTAFSADTMAQSLRDALTAEQKSRQCRILFIPCPSRTLAATIGIVAGYAIGTQTR